MNHKVYHFHAHTSGWHYMWSEAFLAFLLALLVFVSPASAAMRFQERSLFMESTLPNETTSYTVSFRYMSPQPVSSVDFLFCVDPIPYHPCETPEGLDVSNAVLTEQTGETGFSILSQTVNNIVITRPSTAITTGGSSYKFENIVNPTDGNLSFSIRLRSHNTPNATGPQIDFGSVKGQISEGIIIQTQVPPMLIFCVAQEVEENCIDTNETYFTNLGVLDPGSTLAAQSQMAVGTNASGGFAITANGALLSAGTNVIPSPEAPTESLPGTNQFGINLVENTEPAIGSDPQGTWANAVASPDYGIPDRYKYVPGEVVAFSPNVSLMKKFTVSYIINASPELRAGVYSTTINYIASGRF